MNFVIAVSQTDTVERISVLPLWSTFIILVVVVVEMMVAGFFLKRKWLETHENLPIPAALAMMFLMMSLYVLVGSALYWSNPTEHRPQILFWLFVLYIPLCIQYGLNVSNAIVWRITLRVSPEGVEIPDSPLVTQARKLLMAGKIDEAVSLYTSFFERRTPALAEVARQLKAEGKYEEVVSVYTDIVENHASDRVAWPEAAYNLGKIYETQLGEAAKAIALYRRLVDEAPDSRFTHLAGADLARLMVMDSGFIKSLKDDDEEVIPEDPFYMQRRNFLMQRIQQQERMAARAAKRKEDAGEQEDEEGDEDENGLTSSWKKKKTTGKKGEKKDAAKKSNKKKRSTAKKKTATPEEVEETEEPLQNDADAP